MTSAAFDGLIAQLEVAVHGGSPARCAQILRQVTQLFRLNAARLEQQLIDLFDHILVRLIKRVETKALAELSATLSELTQAPKEAVRCLACHEDGIVATTILLRSESLSESDLVEFANHLGQQHLLAISGRKIISEAITDALLRRGDITVCQALARNVGARFSDQGCLKLAVAAERDGAIADALAVRPPMPVKILHDLVAGATKAVQTVPRKAGPPRTFGKILRVIESASGGVNTETINPTDYSESKARIFALSQAGKLGDSTVNRFAVHGPRMDLVAALSLLADAPIEIIEPLFNEVDCSGLVVACRASRLNWQTTLAVINSRTLGKKPSQQQLEHSKEIFEALLLSVAQRTIRFGSVRDVAKPNTTSNALSAKRTI